MIYYLTEVLQVLESQCGWNRSWVPAVLEPCVATKCQHIPLPPPDIGMVYLPGQQLSPHLLSDRIISFQYFRLERQTVGLV